MITPSEVSKKPGAVHRRRLDRPNSYFRLAAHLLELTLNEPAYYSSLW